MKISVIIPVYNGMLYIEEALASIANQTQPPDEVIVVDDGSTDSTRDVIKQSTLDVKYVYQKNQGAQHARNHGLSIATGDTIAFLDADDMWSPNKLQRQAYLLGDSDVVIGLTRILNMEDSTPFILPSLNCALFRASAFDTIGGFDADLPYSDDLDWYMRAREEGLKLVLHRDVVLYHRRHDNNLTNNTAKRQHYHLLMLKKSLTRRRHRGITDMPQFSNFFQDLPEVN